MVNEQKPPPLTSGDVIPIDAFAPLAGKAVTLLTQAPDRTIYIGEDGAPQAVLISITEYDRLLKLDVARIRRDEARFQGDLSRRVASGESLPMDDPAALFASIGFTASDEASGPESSTDTTGDAR